MGQRLKPPRCLTLFGKRQLPRCRIFGKLVVASESGACLSKLRKAFEEAEDYALSVVVVATAFLTAALLRRSGGACGRKRSK